MLFCFEYQFAVPRLALTDRLRSDQARGGASDDSPAKESRLPGNLPGKQDLSPATGLSSAADLIKLAMLRVDALLRDAYPDAH